MKKKNFTPDERADYQSKLAQIPRAMSYSLLIIEPGDILLVGNVGEVDQERTDRFMARIKEILPVEEVIMFANDIDVSVIREKDVRR